MIEPMQINVRFPTERMKGRTHITISTDVEESFDTQYVFKIKFQQISYKRNLPLL